MFGTHNAARFEPCHLSFYDMSLTTTGCHRRRQGV